jgi:hypothetical protein
MFRSWSNFFEEHFSMSPQAFGVLALALFAIYIDLANDGRHHWHEFRYLYSSAHYSTAQLMQGEFDPGPAPLRSPEKVAEWNATELLHLKLLSCLTGVFGEGRAAYEKIKWVYGMMPVVGLGLLWASFRRLGVHNHLNFIGCAFILLNPVFVYLGFNFLGEVSAFFFVCASLFFYIYALKEKTTKGELIDTLAVILSGAALAASALSSVKMPLVFFGFWIANLAFNPFQQTFRKIFWPGLAVILVFAGAWFAGFNILGGHFEIYFSAMRGFLTFTKHLPMWMFAIFNIFLAGMMFWIFLPFSVFSKERALFRFLLLWLAISALPVAFLSVNFLEPRYLVTGLIPFSFLACLGFARMLESMDFGFLKKGFIALSIAGVVAGLAVAQRLMPYETNEDNLSAALREADGDAPGAAILIPWNYSDYHFARFVYPELPVYLVQSAADEKGEIIRDEGWVQGRRKDYGDHFLPDQKALEDLGERKKIYLGWTILPSLQNLKQTLKSLGAESLVRQMDNAPLLNHLTQSWLWSHPDYQMTLLDKIGQYEIYEVRKR